MAYIVNIGREEDKRIKIKPEEYKTIRALYQSGMSLRAIGRRYCVTFKTIKFIVDPEYYERDKARRVIDKSHKRFYDKDKRREYVRLYRARLKQKHGDAYKESLKKIKLERCDLYSYEQKQLEKDYNLLFDLIDKHE